MRLREHAPLGLAVAVALGLRLPWLDAVPNPSGDEGNWTWIAFDLHAHRPASLPPDARFVSLAFARMIAAAYGLLGVSFASARAVLVAGVVAAIVASWLLARRLGAPRAGLAVAALLAVHPWSVLWSRTVTVPYALSLALAVAGPLAWLDGLRTRSPWRLLVASQLLGLAMHFSPLALVPFGACMLHVALRERALLRGGGAAARVAAMLSGLAHVAQMVAVAAVVAGAGATRPNHYFTQLPLRFYVYARAVLGGLDGEATLRHFTGTELPLAGELALAAATVAVVAYALRGPDDARAPAAPLARYARLHLAVALVGLPLILAPARPWNLPAIDAERYAFVSLAPFVLALAASAERPGRARWLAAAVALWCLCGPTARAAWYFARGGSPDRGSYTLAGGSGYRGWKVARERVALPMLLRREVDRLRAGRPATIVVADYAFHPLHFVNAEGGSPTVDVTKFPLPVRPGEMHVFVPFSEGLFAPGFAPASWVEGNARLLALMRSPAFSGLRRARVFTQPDGSPLCEAWVATRAPAAQ